MSKGRTLEDAVREAQRSGIAEADPTLDLEGWDATAKITALANVLMGAGTTPDKAERAGISDLTPEDIARARIQGRKIRMVARAERAGTEVKTSVRRVEVNNDSPFWSVDGISSAVTISTDLMGDITVFETNPAITQTAYAVLSDLLLIVEWMRSNGQS